MATVIPSERARKNGSKLQKGNAPPRVESAPVVPPQDPVCPSGSQTPQLQAEAWPRGEPPSAQTGSERFRRSPADPASRSILNLYWTNLEVRFRTIDETTLQSDDQKTIHATVADMLKAAGNRSGAAGDREWDEIYKAENLIALLLSGAQLRQEIGARLQELSNESPAEAEQLTRAYEALLKRTNGASRGADDAPLRSLLLRVMEAIHWADREKHLGRPIRKQATNRILAGLLVSFALLVVPYLILNIDFGKRDNGFWVDPWQVGAWWSDLGKSDNDFSVGPLWVGPWWPDFGKKDGDFWVSPWWSLFTLWTALTSGLFGAFFSRLISIQRQWARMTLDEVSLHREWPYTLLRAGVGMCGALIIYFFLQSGMAEGALFPNFDEIRMDFVNVPGEAKVNAVKMAYVMPSPALALLTFWCFLAGFSELLVPNLLSATEQQFARAASPAQAARG